jgi:hypothetical protein
MSASAVPLLRLAALFGIPELHPILSWVTKLSPRLVVRAAGLMAGAQWCDPNFCHGNKPCYNQNCGWDGSCGDPVYCQPYAGACESGGSCWTTLPDYTHCCDCFCCDDLGCYYCICHSI